MDLRITANWSPSRGHFLPGAVALLADTIAQTLRDGRIVFYDEDLEVCIHGSFSLTAASS